MSERPELDAETELVELCKAGDEFEARMILGLLEDHGIAAATTGEFSAGFRAEAPGVVRVHVAKRDLEKALQLLRNQRALPSEDFAEESEKPETPSAAKTMRRIAQGIACVIVAYYVLGIAVSLFQILLTKF